MIEKDVMITKLQGELSCAETKIEDLEFGAQQQIEEKDGTIRALEENARIMQLKVEGFEHEKSTMEQRMAEDRRKAEGTDSSIEEMKSKIQVLDDLVRSTRSEADRLEHERSELEKSMVSAQLEAAEKLDERDSKINALEDKLRAASSVIKECEAGSPEANKRVQSAIIIQNQEEEIKALKETLQSAQSRVKEIESQLRQAQVIVYEPYVTLSYYYVTQLEVDGLRAKESIEIKQLIEKNTKLQDLVKENGVTIQNKANNYLELEGKYGEVQTELFTARERLEAVTTEMGNLAAELELVQNHNEDVQIRLQNVEATLQASDNCNQDLQRREEDTQRRIKELKAHNVALQEGLHSSELQRRERGWDTKISPVAECSNDVINDFFHQELCFYRAETGKAESRTDQKIGATKAWKYFNS
ncbi:hypothetical protein DENSPDRAFT_853340 [Dentipellis sp. KUC8613]|nr:hypothetical protein DENSPDRAFT_853340 [Dentipellis sp. KUC8613]